MTAKPCGRLFRPPVHRGQKKDGRHRAGTGGTAAECPEAIFDALSLPVPEVPDELEGLELRLDYMLRPYGVMRRRVELRGKWWLSTMGPLLGSTKAGDVVALLDPASGKKVKVNSKTAAQLGTEAFCFYRALPARPLKLLDLVAFMLRSLSVDDLAFVLVISLLVSLLGMFLPYMNKQIFDSVIPTGTKSDLLPLAALLIGATVGSALFSMTRTLGLMRLRDKINHSVQCAALARLFTLPVSFFKGFSAGEISRRAISVNTLTEMLSDTVLTSLLAALFSFVYIFQMAGFAPVLVAPALLSIGGLLTLTFLTGLIRQKHSRRLMELSAKLDGMVFGLLGGIQKIKLAGAERRAFARWAAQYKELGRLRYNPPTLLPLSGALQTLLVKGSTIILYYVAGRGLAAPSDYMAFNAAYGAVSSALLSLGGVVVSLAKRRGCFPGQR